MKHLHLIIIAALAVSSVFCCSAYAADSKPNILFLMADDWSSPHAGVLGDPVVKTPTFDRMAREGVLFHNAFVSAPSCTPSRLAVATGQWHWRLKEGVNLSGSIREGVPVYPEILQAAGYQIGFARKGAEPSKQEFTHRDPFGPKFKSFEDFFAQRKAGEPFCFWYGAGEPHRPYRYEEGRKDGMDPAKMKLPACLPDNETTRNDFCDYLHRIQRYDTFCAQIIALLEKSGELENTIVVMSGDNGLPFPRCKATLYDTGTHVPLAIRWGAKVKGGRTVSDFVSLTDLAPTFLEAAGLKAPAEMTGHSLMPILKSEKSGQLDATRTAVFTGMERHVFTQPCRAIRTADFLYIRNFELEKWPTLEKSEPLPPIDYASGEWLTTGNAFPFNLEQSPTLQFMFAHRDDAAVNRSFALACSPRPEEELFDLKADPDQLRNVAADLKYAAMRRRLGAQLTRELRNSGDPRASITREVREVSGWKVHINTSLLDSQRAETEYALELLKKMLDEIAWVVPKAAVVELQKVPLYFSPLYPGARTAAEFHSDEGWLRNNGRDPIMAKGVEFSGIADFGLEMNRLPNFALHELAHAYHNRVVKGSFDNAEIKTAYEKAKASGKYERVERWNGNGKPNTFERAYAMTNPMEYFAECTEAFFTRNDFFPFTREELARHDPGMFALMDKLWVTDSPQPKRKTAAAHQQPPVDFNHPPRDYVSHRLHGWEVLVQKQLADETPELTKAALARIDAKLGEIAKLLPVMVLPDLQRVEVFLMRGPKAKGGGRESGLEYFHADAPKHHDWLDARMASSIVIFNAENYVKLTDQWAIKVLMHEFGHAQHLEHWPESRADIYDAWDHAMKAGLYQVVREEDKGSHNPNYAAQNHLEYFAELTAAYFVGINYFPRDRAGLKTYDPAGYALIEELWGISRDLAPAASNQPSPSKL